MLNVGDKIYYIDYEESNSSYTIKVISNEKGNSVMKEGTYYTIHSDILSGGMGYYPLLVDEVDKEFGRFFSTPEKAHQEYVKFNRSLGGNYDYETRRSHYEN